MSEGTQGTLPPYKKIIGAFVQQELALLELGQSEGRRNLADFADLTFDLYSHFKEVVMFSANPFIKDRTLFSFAREIVYFGYLATHMAISNTFRELLQADINEIRAAFAQDKPPLLTEEAAQEDLKIWTERLQHANSLDVKRREELREVTVNQIGFPFLDNISVFYDMYRRCTSPLEQVFLVGMFTLRDSWPRLLDPAFFTNQYQIGDYRLDFVFFGEDNRKIVVEIDGHTDHERTEDQAVYDRKRNRLLQSAGWKVLQFHHKEIEDDLDRCVQQVVHTVRGLPIVGVITP